MIMRCVLTLIRAVSKAPLEVKAIAFNTCVISADGPWICTKSNQYCRNRINIAENSQKIISLSI